MKARGRECISIASYTRRILMMTKEVQSNRMEWKLTPPITSFQVNYRTVLIPNHNSRFQYLMCTSLSGSTLQICSSPLFMLEQIFTPTELHCH